MCSSHPHRAYKDEAGAGQIQAMEDPELMLLTLDCMERSSMLSSYMAGARLDWELSRAELPAVRICCLDQVRSVRCEVTPTP